MNSYISSIYIASDWYSESARFESRPRYVLLWDSSWNF
jgi:hypothetical protein